MGALAIQAAPEAGNDTLPAGPQGCRWALVISTCKANGWTAFAVWFAQQKLAGRDLDDCLSEVVKAYESVAARRAR